MTNSQSVEQDGIVAGNIFAMLDNANRGVNRMKFISLATDDRQTDGRATAYSEREREFTFAKNQWLAANIFSIRSGQ